MGCNREILNFFEKKQHALSQNEPKSWKFHYIFPKTYRLPPLVTLEVYLHVKRDLGNLKVLGLGNLKIEPIQAKDGIDMGKTKPGRQARYRVQRRLGTELPGLGKPGALERRPYPPGENGNKRKKYSDYALRLEEKQKIRHHYGLREEQLRRFIRDSKKGVGTAWVTKLIGRLELRLDNVIFRLGFAPSIRAARQFVSHGHVLVNGNRLNVSSAVVKVGDEITLKPKAYESQTYLYAKQSPRLELADYLKKEEKEGKEMGTILAVPNLEHVPFPFDSGLFTEYYAQRKA